MTWNAHEVKLAISLILAFKRKLSNKCGNFRTRHAADSNFLAHCGQFFEVRCKKQRMAGVSEQAANASATVEPRLQDGAQVKQ